MYLALKKTHASDATPLQKLISNLIKWRLCSSYSHSGLVIDNVLYHSSYINHGLRCEKFIMEESSGWDFFYLGDENDEKFLETFKKFEGTPYDLIGLLTFILPFKADFKELYCFEWCGLALGLNITTRVTPEDLLLHISKNKS